MMKLNNKGFAVSTILYGILALTIIILMLIFGIMKSNKDLNQDLASSIEENINKCVLNEVELENCYFSEGNCDVNSFYNCIDKKGYEVPEESNEALLVTEILGENNTNVVSSGDGLYVSTETNDGRSTYYYKGNVTNNYVDFAGLTWRVVRINEDGTIKLILDDRINNTTYLFNPNYSNYKYMYYSESNITNGIKNTVDNWYNSTLKTNYDSYIVTTSFCESAKVKINDSLSENATMQLSSSYTPNFKCEEDGNNKQYVNAKAGLITVDEVVMVGIPLYTGSQVNNKNTYLQKSFDWWTMSPGGFHSTNNALLWRVNTNGNVYTNSVSVYNGARPVISLKADTRVTGIGTEDDKWVVVTE